LVTKRIAMLRKYKRMKLRYKLFLFILPQCAFVLLLYVYTANLLENEVAGRLAEHNRILNQSNVRATQDVLNAMINLCDVTIRLDSHSLMSEIELLTTQLSQSENIIISFANISGLWRLHLLDSSYIEKASIVTYTGQTVYMRADEDVSFISTIITFTDPDVYWMHGAIAERGGYYISVSEYHLRVSREIIHPTSLARLGVITIESKIPFATATFEKNKIFADQQYALFINGQLSVGNTDFDIEDFMANVNASTGFDFIDFDRSNDSITLYYRQTSPTELISITVMPHNAVFMRAFGRVGGFVFVAFFGLLGIVLGIFLVFIMRSVLRSLKLFESAFAQIERGEFGRTIDEEVESELQDFLDSYNHMSRKLGELIHEVYERELTEHKLELQMLREQITPHFLYNTLETLRMNCLIGKEEKNIQIIEYLGKLLRYSISSGDKSVATADELMCLDYYVKLCNLRHDYSVKLRCFVQPELMRQPIMRLLFQPIVENSILHGMLPAESKLEIQLTGYVDADCAVYTITDNGVGISKEKANHINENLKENTCTGIGLYNVHRRIRLIYGEAYGLTISPRSICGTEVQIIVPFVQEAVTI